MDAWAQAWIHEHVPALGGLTPREAVDDPQAIFMLEMLLRQFEYREDGNLKAGRASANISAIREALRPTDT
ncbi:MAG: hypothetical protein WDA27_07670 [Actinomycetota bacterium]